MFNLLFLMLLTGPIPVPADAQRAAIIVQLPAEAQLYVDDVPVKQAGARRQLVFEPLEPGFLYYCVLRMEWSLDGRVVRSSRKIELRPGQTAVVVFAAPAPAAGQPAGKKQASVPSQRADAAGLSAAETELWRLTNQERADAGLAPLAINATLTRAARQHSANMARQGKMDHVLDDKNPSDRLHALGYRGFTWGENIAYGMPTPANAIRVWMGSEGHRANILNEQYNEIGLGIAADEQGVPYYTQVFGRKSGR